ncbi:MAG: hypothetical protein Q4F07_06055 [Bacteroidales bacterium]|nr:hypothetical protein [Bacteroidales bacterium]
MKKHIVFVLAAVATLCALATEDDELMLSGRVKEAVSKYDLTKAQVLLYDSAGNVRDSISANKGRTWRDGQIDTLSVFYFGVPRVDSTYVFDVVCEGYKPQTVTYSVKDVGRREQFRNIPVVYMERAPKMLKELTVTATKIKFYNKGDTIVYNADAFQLAEGSMLDALIAQLPGVELNNDGQIKVNGEFVESLLLNGKEFLDGNNNLMLENIGAYTVKNVQVYEGQTAEAKRRGDLTAPKVLTMDVRLKREYNMGWLVNAQGGYGTEDRYSGRLFALWFTPTTRLTLLGNVNNLNDNRRPGKNDTWTPEMMPSGKKEYRMAGIGYSYENPENTRQASGDFIFRQTVNNNDRTTARTNFLPGGDTYDNSFSHSRMRETNITTQHDYYTSIKNRDIVLGARVEGNYNHTKNSQSELSGAFLEEQTAMTSEILEALYSDGSPELLENVINRAGTRADGWHKTLGGAIGPYVGFRIPKTEDRIFFNLSAKYRSDKEEQWRDYTVNYGADPTPAVRRRQYIDNTPNHCLELRGGVQYSTSFGGGYGSLAYSYRFSDEVKDSYMYALDHLADMGVYGVVPANYLQTLDPANSYTSRTIENRHTLTPSYRLYKPIGDNNMLIIGLRPEFEFVHRHLNYWRDNRAYRKSTDNFMFTINSIWNGMLEYQFGAAGEGRAKKYRNSVRYSYRMEPTLPDLVDMLDIVNDADPLNIYLGNPDLRKQTRHNHLARWSWTPHSHTFQNILYLGYIHTDKTLVRGYTYDTATGIRYNRMYNVQGDHRVAVTNELNWQFGSSKQFTLSSETDISKARYSDMIGVNLSEPEHVKVNYRTIGEKFRLTWQFAGQSLQARLDYTNRHTTSSQQGFNTLNANHVNYGLTGTFALPAGFGISTDFTCYTRRGYGTPDLDTTDPIWNMRLTYRPPRNSRWVFMVDGFDMLHKLSNVNYAVTATGRTVSYTNALPRYVLFSVQYRLNIQPKKR